MAEQASAPKPDKKAPRGDSPDIARGVAVLKDKLRTLPNGPGVYRMLNSGGDVLYVGKARSLKKRVTSYTHPAKLSHRIFRMIGETIDLEVVTTHTEVEALLLESNLIKKFKPRYNVLLRDDKSFPFILIPDDHSSPQVVKHRGAQKRKGAYFGPFASAGAVNRTITALQRAFLIRNCSDAVFSARTRPCLQYQIKRCAAPCVDYITPEAYDELVDQARKFLSGKSRQVQDTMAGAMKDASDKMDFEAAAIYRDRIRALTAIQAHQDINVAGVDEADVIALHSEGGVACIQVFFFRAGSNYGNRAYFPSHDKSISEADILAAFLGQFYENKPPPKLVMLSHEPTENDLIEEALSISAGRKVSLSVPKRGDKVALIKHALANAKEALARRFADSNSQRRLLEGVAEVFDLDAPPERIEIYDNSHIQGTNAIGAMVVAGPEGFIKNAYRKFNIKGVASPSEAAAGQDDDRDEIDAKVDEISGSDDFAMMRQVLGRRFARALKEDPERQSGTWPDLVLIDGGQGQLSAVLETAEELGLSDLNIAAIAKGPDRNAGRERFFLPGKKPFSLERRDPTLYYLQRLRDEAHRFAINTHRARRAKGIGRSVIDEIEGIGAKRKKALLLHFGSAREVARAGLSDLENVEGISTNVARKIYDHFHDDA